MSSNNIRKIGIYATIAITFAYLTYYTLCYIMDDEEIQHKTILNNEWQMNDKIHPLSFWINMYSNYDTIIKIYDAPSIGTDETQKKQTIKNLLKNNFFHQKVTYDEYLTIIQLQTDLHNAKIDECEIDVQ